MTNTVTLYGSGVCLSVRRHLRLPKMSSLPLLTLFICGAHASLSSSDYSSLPSDCDPRVTTSAESWYLNDDLEMHKPYPLVVLSSFAGALNKSYPNPSPLLKTTAWWTDKQPPNSSSCATGSFASCHALDVLLTLSLFFSSQASTVLRCSLCPQRSRHPSSAASV